MSADYDRLFGPFDRADGGDAPDDSVPQSGYDVSRAPSSTPNGSANPTSNGHPPPIRFEPPAPTAGPPVAEPAPGRHAKHSLPESSNGQRRTDRITVARPGPAPVAVPAHHRPARVFTDGTAKPVPRRGWRRGLHRVTRINPGLSRAEKREVELRGLINSRTPRDSYQIGVLGLKGGGGKTALTVALGSLLAEVRGDRILVIDADPAAGNLADRVGRESDSSIVDLVGADRLAHYTDIRSHTSANAVDLEVLAAEDHLASRYTLTESDWHRIVDAVSRFYNLVLIDCGGGLPVPSMRALLSEISAVVIVAGTSADGAAQVDVTLDWLQRNTFGRLADRACVVLTQLVPELAQARVRDIARRFEGRIAPERIVVLPWDDHIAAGAEIRLDRLGEPYLRRLLELTALLSEDFERDAVR